MSERPRCPNCGEDLPLNAPQGLCPACLLKQGMESAGAGPGSSTAARPPDPDATKDYESGAEPGGPDGAVGPGTRLPYFGDYELIKELGRGGMGIVYKARQISLNRLVALKLLKSDILASDEERRRFQNEAEAVAFLDHPRIVPIYEVGEHDGRQYFSMKFVDGPSLDKRLADFAPDPKAIARLVETAARAMQHAHQRGILHRDLKPANILLDDGGQPHITDFGLAKRIESNSEMTVSGAILGTPSYMAPEQASGRRGAVSTATDIYGLGAVLYALLTGRPPFRGNTVVETIRLVQEHVPAAPSKFNPSISRDLDAICLKCLEKDPSRRYASAQALADDLHCCFRFRPIAARRVSPIRRAWLYCRRNTLAAGLMTATIALVVASMIGVFSTLRGRLLARQFAHEQELAFRSRYDFTISHVQPAWENYDLARMGHLLHTFIRQDPAFEFAHPEPNFDPEGFEAHFWKRRLASGHQNFRGRTSVAFSPDGGRIVFAAEDGFEVWEVSSGRMIRGRQRFRDNKSVESVAFSQDGTLIATGLEDGSIEVFKAQSGEKAFVIEGHTRSVTSVRFSPDGGRLLSSSADRTIRLWEAGTGREAGCFNGHTDRVSSADFSRDGARIASGSYDGTIRFWDSMTGRMTLKIPGNFGPILSVAFSPDGRELAAADSFRGLRVWDALSGQTRSVLGESRDGSFQGYTCVAYSSDGRRLAAACSDLSLRIWDTSDGREALALKGHGSPVTCLAFSPDGTKLASASDRTDSSRTTVKVWDAINGQEPPSIKVHMGPVFDVLFSPDGSRLAATGRDSTVTIWDTGSGLMIMSLKGPAHTINSSYVSRRYQEPNHERSRLPITGMAFSPDGTRLAAAGSLGVKVWDAKGGREILHYKGHTDNVTGVAFSPDGKLIASAGLDTLVKIWDAATGGEVLTIQGHPFQMERPTFNYRWSGSTHDERFHQITNLAYSPVGQRIASGGPDGIRLWDASSGKAVSTIYVNNVVPAEPRFVSLAFSPDGKGLVTVDPVGTVKIWNAADGQETLILEKYDEKTNFREWVVRAVFSPDGRRLAVARWGGKVQVLEGATGKVLLSVKGHPNQASSVTFSPDGKRIASAGDDGATVWDAKTGREILSFNGRSGHVFSVAYYPDGSRFVASGEDGTVRVYDAGSFREVLTLTGHSARVNSVAISPDSTRIASASDDRTVKLWNSANGEVVLGFEAHAETVNSVVFSPDCMRVASASSDGTVKVWDSNNGRVTLEKALGIPVNSVTFSPNGSRLAASTNGVLFSPTVFVWDSVTGERFCEFARANVAKVAFSPDGSLVATTRSANAQLFSGIWQTNDGRWLRELTDVSSRQRGGGPANDITFSPDGTRLASAQVDGTVKVWDAATGLETLTLKGHTDEVWSVAFSPDGHQLISASADGTVRVWDARRLHTELKQ
jgi:eukaryotic-like serine/threonine-protein kinase